MSSRFRSPDSPKEKAVLLEHSASLAGCVWAFRVKNLGCEVCSSQDIPSRKPTFFCTWKWMVGRLVSFWEGLFSGAMLVSGRVKSCETDPSRLFSFETSGMIPPLLVGGWTTHLKKKCASQIGSSPHGVNSFQQKHLKPSPSLLLMEKIPASRTSPQFRNAQMTSNCGFGNLQCNTLPPLSSWICFNCFRTSKIYSPQDPNP